MKRFSIALHGGAGTILRQHMTAEKERAYKEALDNALEAGYAILAEAGSAIDAVERAVVELEDSPLFNAGRGSVFTAAGKHEMDASIMEGRTLGAGAVSLVTNVKNPVVLARLVMEKSGHVFLAGDGAMAFAKAMKCELRDEDYFYDEFRYRQWQETKGSGKTQLDHTVPKEDKFGTVGAVALDQHGNLAAATSTGGMTNKKFGRVGDSPMIGAGNYANNATCAVSCTGSGEFFIRGVVAYDVSCLMEYKNLALRQACDEVIHQRLKRIGGDGGLVAVDAKGNMAMPFNTDGMYRASCGVGQDKIIEIYK
ncbi:MAG: isoaspartyl peptidase/L-asparaginase [Cyclobacteriaceae bacterium]|nr:isoaspartyl peptidase/L-asparaginase [Cyclobacteriaceae bacterium]MCB0500513.1 isoaspartyl peptidase/L-asparaginase [Cyclobacteriaceae bacterium]MCB9238464.1 isoaspartyl peptidase/L-asparaginase [Flammeovirgaceae bacterium]MCO5271411.1 isoaspartyl peptidase/L-asparaginase [Cyclobacteriaceae bacterium]MCW5903590.1 isoaspartyl peptidase/L-asparaginase [Cyclobacteriaceae bacterium]